VETVGLLDAFGLSRLRDGLVKTRQSIFGKIQGAFPSKRRIDHEVLNGIEQILLEADIGVGITAEIIERLKKRVKESDAEVDVNTIVREEIQAILTTGTNIVENGKDPEPQTPHVVMVVGVNGVGKTTTIGKLANMYRTSGKKVVIAAADTFRAAANEQLDIWANRAGVDLISAGSGGSADPAAVAFDALRAAVARHADVLIVDTAGRLHTKVNLMEELKKIKRVMQKQIPGAPHDVLLVLDASIGQNAIQQARRFGDAVGITGLVITKLDGTARGGVVLAVARELNVPIRYIGVGERIDDLQPFDRKAFVEALLES
jgi:fused signal recognition particle receptor